MCIAEAGHLKRVGHTTARILCQSLNFGIRIVMGNDDRILPVQPLFNLGDKTVLQI